MLQRATFLLENVLNVAKVDAGHGITHALAVLEHAKNAVKYGKNLSAIQRKSIKLASLLHDADDSKFFNHKNYENARMILKDIEFPEADSVIEMISLVSTSKNRNRVGLEDYKYYPRWADRLEAIGEIGIVRCYVYTKHVGMHTHTDTTPRVTSLKELEIVAPPNRFDSYNGKSISMMDHFYDKLVHLGDFDSKNEYIERVKMERMESIYDFVFNFGKSGSLDTERLDDMAKSLNL
jgi:uncharacterized protein